MQNILAIIRQQDGSKRVPRQHNSHEESKASDQKIFHEDKSVAIIFRRVERKVKNPMPVKK